MNTLTKRVAAETNEDSMIPSWLRPGAPLVEPVEVECDWCCMPKCECGPNDWHDNEFDNSNESHSS